LLILPLRPISETNEELEDWIFELTQVGSYYYGLATSGVNTIDTGALEEFDNELKQIHVSVPDELLYQKCQTYLDSISAMVQAANNIKYPLCPI
jgi:hypothetical protein